MLPRVMLSRISEYSVLDRGLHPVRPRLHPPAIHTIVTIVRIAAINR